MVQELRREEGKSEMGMTDLQFTKHHEIIAERDALRNEVRALRGNGGASSFCEGGMTDLQFQGYKDERNRREALERKLLRMSLLEILKSSSDLPEAIAKAETLLGSQ